MSSPAGWTGEAAEVAQTRRAKIVDRMEQIVAEVSAARTGLRDAADGIVGLSHAVQDAEHLARARTSSTSAPPANPSSWRSGRSYIPMTRSPGKMDAFSTGEHRETFDVDAILTSGRYGRAELEQVAREQTPASTGRCSPILGVPGPHPRPRVEAHVAGPQRIRTMRTRFTQWRQEIIRNRLAAPHPHLIWMSLCPQITATWVSTGIGGPPKRWRYHVCTAAWFFASPRPVKRGFCAAFITRSAEVCGVEEVDVDVVRRLWVEAHR